MWVCVTFLLLIAALYLFTRKYGKSKRKEVDKSQHKLWMIYGMAMFWWISHYVRLQNSNRLLNEKFKSLYVKERVQEEKYLYVVSKVSLVIAVIFIAAIFEFVCSYSTDGMMTGLHILAEVILTKVKQFMLCR